MRITKLVAAESEMKPGLIVLTILWLISAFSYVTSAGIISLDGQGKKLGVVAVVLIFVAALITRTKTYLNLYDRQVLRTANTPVFFLRTLTWVMLLCTCIILFMHFSAADNSLAKSNNAFLSIFAFLTFFAGRSLLLRAFSR